MQQHGYLAHLLPALKAEGLHVVLETCGVFPWAHMEPLLPYLDAVFFDLKHMDRRWHERLTGGDNTLVLANFSERPQISFWQEVRCRLPWAGFRSPRLP